MAAEDYRACARLMARVLPRGGGLKGKAMKRGFGHYASTAVRWLLVAPVVVVVYAIASAVTALLGVWYLSAGAVGLIVSLFTVTFPYWILLHLPFFDPPTVVYLVQSFFAAPLAIAAAALVAPAVRFRTAIALFIIQVVLIGGQVLLEVTGYAEPENLHAPWVLAASALLGLFGGVRVLAAVHEFEQQRPTQKAKIRVLVADDVIATRFVLTKTIGLETDMEVVAHAGSGLEAILRAFEERPDVVLMDINMPGMDGITATRIISEVVPDSSVIMASVQGSQDYLRGAMDAGAGDYIVEPAAPEEFTTAIRGAVARALQRGSVRPSRPQEDSSMLLEKYRPKDASNEGPCRLLLTEADMPEGFRLWAAGEPLNYPDQETRYCSRSFTNGTRPATDSAHILFHVSVCDSVENAVRLINGVASEVNNSWLSAQPSRWAAGGLPRWPKADGFVIPRLIPIALREQSVAWETILFGRRVTWAYVRLGNTVWGIRAENVPSATVLSLAAHSALKSPSGSMQLASPLATGS